MKIVRIAEQIVRIARIAIQFVICCAILVFVVGFSQDFAHRISVREEIFLCSSFSLLFFAACLGLILELRQSRWAAFFNPTIPAVFATLALIDALLFGEPEGVGVTLFYLIPVPILWALLQGALYHMVPRSESGT